MPIEINLKLDGKDQLKFLCGLLDCHVASDRLNGLHPGLGSLLEVLLEKPSSLMPGFNMWGMIYQQLQNYQKKHGIAHGDFSLYAPPKVQGHPLKWDPKNKEVKVGCKSVTVPELETMLEFAKRHESE